MLPRSKYFNKNQVYKAKLLKYRHNLLDNCVTNNIDMRFLGINDLRLAIQNCTLVNPKITKDGYFEGTIVDYFDFEDLPFEEKDGLKTIYLKDLNN